MLNGMARIPARAALFLLLFIVIPVGEAAPPVTHQYSLEVFIREGCPHCNNAKEYLRQFSKERPELRITFRRVGRDPKARDDLIRHSRNAGIWPPGVPTFVFADRVLVGFESAKRTGAELAAIVDQFSRPSQAIETDLFGTLSVTRLGLPLFTLALGLLDGFNPCAMWVLLFLLSLLVHLHDRKRMALVAGTFVLISAVVYYTFMAAWLNIFLLVGFSQFLNWLLGAVAMTIGIINIIDFISSARAFSLSIPASAKPGLYSRVRKILAADSLLPSLAGVAALAVVVNFIELLCTAGFPAIYTAVLTQQGLSPVEYYGYLGLYIVGYMADDALMVTVAVVSLSNQKLSERTGRYLKLVSGSVMLMLGVILILRPEWLV